MAQEYLSAAQVDRYGRFVADPTPEELEKFFFLDAAALKEARDKRRLHNRLGWSIQWGTVRMLGTFLTDSGPADVPQAVVEYVAERLGISDVSVAKLYGDRPQTPYEHASIIRTMLGYREFSAAEEEVATFIACRVRKSRDSRRELFDRAVLWLINNRVLLPGITTLSRLVAEVRRGELEAINRSLAEAAPPPMRVELVQTLQVPDGRKVSTLEWMRTAVSRLSGTGMEQALDRASYVLGLGTGAVDCTAVAPVKLAELARFGMTAKAFRIEQLEKDRRLATLLATVRQLEGTAVDDALLLFDLLMSTVLLARAGRAADKEKLRNLPRLRVAASRLATAWTILLETPPSGPAEEGDGPEGERPDGEQHVFTVPEVLDHIEQVVSRQQLAAAVETVLELLPLPSTEDDGDLKWRVELLDRFGTVRPFVDMLASVIPWGCTAAGSPILAALRALPRLMAARKPGREHIKGFEDLVTGSWRRLVFGNPKLDPPLIDRPAYTFCILEALHAALRRRDVYAVGADKWGNPRARLIEERLWVRERAAVLTALGLDADPAVHLRELAELLDGAYRQVAAGLPANAAVSIKGGKLHLSRLQAAPEIAAASGRLVDKQAEIDITADWGSGLVASVDGMRFVVPVRSLYARPSPLYFGVGTRATNGWGDFNSLGLRRVTPAPTPGGSPGPSRSPTPAPMSNLSTRARKRRR